MLNIYNPDFFVIDDKGTTTSGKYTSFVKDICCLESGPRHAKKPNPFVRCFLNEENLAKNEDVRVKSILRTTKDGKREIARVKISSCAHKYSEDIIVAAIPFFGKLCDIQVDGATLLKVAVKGYRRGKNGNELYNPNSKVCYIVARVDPENMVDSADLTSAGVVITSVDKNADDDKYIIDNAMVEYCSYDGHFTEAHTVDYITEEEKDECWHELDLLSLANELNKNAERQRDLEALAGKSSKESKIIEK